MIGQNATGFTLHARLAGEAINADKLEREADVKGGTLHRLRVAQRPNGWEVAVILDV